MIAPPLPDGTYIYTKACMYSDYTLTVQLLGGRPVLGI